MSEWYEIAVQPRDVLFFCSAKPMNGSSIGEGARWPMPAVFHHSLLGAMHERWPETDSDFEHQHYAAKSDVNRNSSFRFGGLQSAGLFPKASLGEIYLPAPSDLQYMGESQDAQSDQLCLLEPGTLDGCGDLPAPLEKGLFKPGKATKNKPLPWLTKSEFVRYLQGSLSDLTGRKSSEIFTVESRAGIGLNAETGTVEEGQLYFAEYMRLNDGYTLAGLAKCKNKRYADGGKSTDVLGKFLESKSDCSFILGGQRGVAYLSGEKNSCFLDDLTKAVNRNSQRIKWVTLTPSIFNRGWLPGWINPEDGSISASQVSKPERNPGETREEWRVRFEKQPVPGKLVAASVPKPLEYSGWRVHGGNDKIGARPTRLCVPAGAVYYFDVPAGQSVEPLLKLLNGRCKSGVAAEKGFGLGVCGNW
ncbi:MAG: type III-B CRISPR module-associated Cmr3 family protein [Kiritimatiellia bacterium]